MIYRLDDLYESQDFEHDQKFVKAEHWKEACDELEDKVKTIAFKDQEITKLKKSLEIANNALISLDKINDHYSNYNSEINSVIMEAQKQIKEIMGDTDG